MSKKKILITHGMQEFEADPLSDDPEEHESNSASDVSKSDLRSGNKRNVNQADTKAKAVKRGNSKTKKIPSLDCAQASTSRDNTMARTSQPSLSKINAKKIKLDKGSKIKSKQQDEKYFKLAEEGDVKMLKKSKQVNLLQDRDKDKNTYLHRCIQKCLNVAGFTQMKSMIRYLLSEAPELYTVVNNYRETPLCWACRNVSHNALILLLVNSNTDMLNVSDKIGYTPLHFVATSLGWKSKIMSHDYNHIEPERDDVTKTALKLAETFIQLGADVNAVNDEGVTVLEYTLKHNLYFDWKTPQEKEIYHTFVFNMLELLRKHNASFISTSNKHAIFSARTVREAEWVLDQDPDILNKDPGPRNYSTIYHFINMFGAKTEGDKMIDLLIKRGAIERNQIDLIALARFKKCKFFVIESLLKRFPKYNVNTLTADGESMITQYGKDIKTIDKLVAMGANINAPDLTGATCLWTAAKKGSVAAIKKILDAGADPGEFPYSGICVLIPICHEFTKKNCRLPSYLQLLAQILDYPSITSSPMSESLEQVFSLIFEDLFNCLLWPRTKDRLQSVLTCIFNCNENIKTIVFKQNQRYRKIKMAGYTFNYQLFDFMGYAIHVYTSRSDFTLELSVEKLVNLLLDFRISVSNTNNGCITAITSALMGTENDNITSNLTPRRPRRIYMRDLDKNSAAKDEIDRINNQFIQLGVKTNIQALQIECVVSNIFINTQKKMMLQLIKSTYLPDTLLVSLLRNKLELAKKLISDWCGPPLALLIFNPNWHYKDFIPWFEMLQHYGGIPHGTQMFQLMKSLLNKMHESARYYYTGNPEHEFDFSPKFQAFEKYLEPILSLEQLAKYALRQSVAERASQQDTNLSAVLQDLLPPLLYSTVIQ